MSGYNYDNFSSKDYDFDTVIGPKIGEKAQDFLVATNSGEPKYLLDFDGDFLVLEMGSITCPLFQNRRETMEKLDDNEKRVSTAVLYVREAHPGAQIPQHQSFEEKQSCAQRLKTEDKETRLVFVDDFEGTVHKAYGEMPNAVFIINKNDCVVFRAEWNNPSTTKKALKALLEGRTYRAKSYFWPGKPSISVKTLRSAGKGSAADFLKSFPALIWHNLIKRNLRLLFNRPQPVPRDTVC